MPLWITVVLLGIIEGITEFLPVSSTGHLLIAEHWLPQQTILFNVVIQCGAVLAVLPLFPERLRQFFFCWREPATRDYLLKIFVACAITGGPGYVLEKKNFKLDDHLMPIAIALFVGGVLFIIVEKWLRNRPLKNEVTWTIVIAVGIGQLIAAVGELCTDLHGRGLWDAADTEILEAIWQFRRNFEAATAVVNLAPNGAENGPTSRST